MNYEGLSYDKEELSAIMNKNYNDILDFISQPVFQTLFSEMMILPPNERPKYVHDVWLNSKELENRGLKVPEGILIQTSAFEVSWFLGKC